MVKQHAGPKLAGHVSRDATQIRSYSAGLGHLPIIDINPRRGEKNE
jgi:hypothetical protein